MRGKERGGGLESRSNPVMERPVAEHKDSRAKDRILRRTGSTSIVPSANQLTDDDLRDRTLETDSKELDFPAYRLTTHRMPTVTSRPFGSLPSQALTIYIYHHGRPFCSPVSSLSFHSCGVRVLGAPATATHRIMIIRVLRCHKGKQSSGEGN